MNIKEFLEKGYLTELNRDFLHPLGLHLNAIEEEDGTIILSDTVDETDEPEGFIFGDGFPEGHDKLAEAIKNRRTKIIIPRLAKYGYNYQPIKEDFE